MTIEKNVTLQINELFTFQDLELQLTDVVFEKIHADTEDENIPNWDAINVYLHLFLENKKKKITLSVLTEPYESIKVQTWKNYKIVLQKANKDSVKVKLQYSTD